MKTLQDITPGKQAVIVQIHCSGGMRRRLLDIGLTPGAKTECVGVSPCGDPKAYLVRGAVIALRSEDAAQVEIA